MANPAPLLDKRTEKEIRQQVKSLIKTYLVDWPEFKPESGVSGALIGIFARYASLIIQRLNQAPNKNFLAFLDLLGASRLPPAPARVPLTFSLAPGSAVEAVIRAGTQVAALPVEGEVEPVIFETEHELVATAANLVSLFVRDPNTDQYADQSVLLTSPLADGAPAYSGNRPIGHILYIGHDNLLAFPGINELQIDINLENNLPDPVDIRAVNWEIWDGEQGIPLITTSDGTNNLTKNGALVVSALPAVQQRTIAGINNRWLRARLITPITPQAGGQNGMVRQEQLPEIRSITMQATVQRSSTSIDAAFSNLLPLDISKDFYPFGEKPRFGDALYLSSAEVFSNAGAKVIVHVKMSSVDSGISLPEKNDIRKLALEYWDGAAWVAFKDATDNTSAFTQSGDLTFTIPDNFKPTDRPTGLMGYWMRIRLSAGDYGKEATYVPDRDLKIGYKYVPATFTPPSIANLSIDFELTKSGATPEQVITYNDFRNETQSPQAAYLPFSPMQDTRPGIYLGFTLPPTRKTFPNRPLSLYFRLADVLYGQVADNIAPVAPPRLVWEYWNGVGWNTLVVNDETDSLTHSGLVELLPPADFQESTEFGITRYWLRVRWVSGNYKFLPRLCTVLPNTTTATQTVTITNETLGSSNGGENQAFLTTRTPVLINQRLQVRESDLPSAEEQKIIEDEEGKDAITILRNDMGHPNEVWVRWHQVPDFYASGPRDRHYVLDHLTGKVNFGDGISGRIPPVGPGNIRMERYRTGGGARGNLAAGSIVQLKTTVPYVDKVTNYDAARGGAEAESLDVLIARAPRTVRHRMRAVTSEDYEDLAMLASPEVARSRCVPLYDLAVDPDATNELPGTLSLIIVPRSTGPKPLASLDLIERVKKYLDGYRTPTADLVVVGPDYVHVNIDVEISLASLDVASAVELAAEAALTKFLHPLTGGPDGTGWQFGRRPYPSDIYVLLEAIPGVDHIRSLKLTVSPERAGADQTDLFLVCAGNRTIACIFEES